jgi:hypothetical protein
MEGFVVILLVLGAIVLAAVLFCAWVVVAVVKGVFRLVMPKRRRGLMVNDAVQMCGNPQCKCANPSHARFCRRCGKSLPSLLRVVSSRAAVL